MYNKIFTKILDSSVWLEATPTRIVWITLIAAMDEDGFCHFAAIGNVASRARVTEQEAARALEVLAAPDPQSSDLDNEGRRVERVPGGWMVLNAAKYRALVTRATSQESSRIRVKAFRERKRNGFDKRFETQDGLCDCCRSPFEVPYNLYVVQDHNHSTGQIRGLICQSCNKSVGMIENNKRIVGRDPAIYFAYVKRWSNADVTESSASVTQSEAYTDTEAKGEAPPSPVTPKRVTDGYDPSADPLENIPEGLALLQYAGFVAEQVGIPAGYALKVKIGDTLGIMASGGLMGSAVRELIGRMKAAGTQKWLFWLEDGGWKDDAGSNATEAAFLGGSV